MEKGLVLEQIHKTYADGSLILENISLKLDPGTKLSVLGPSGSGKTTLLRMIAGLESPDSGTIRFNGTSLAGCPPHRRHFGMMFQDFALFPHLNVFDNIAFGLKIQGIKKKDLNIRVQEMLTLTGLAGFETRHVEDLSGGERQRVALARTLAPRPRLLMLDEPLSALDRVLRKRLLVELTRILSNLQIITIFVTHDHEEAFAAGNRVLIMNQGRIEQIGTPRNLMETPENQWVKDFLGL